VDVIPRIDKPVEPKIVEELLKKFVEFRKAYEEDGMKIEGFDGYGATVRTIRGFSQSCHDLAVLIRDFMLPNPDK
jgi:transaldolase